MSRITGQILAGLALVWAGAGMAQAQAVVTAYSRIGDHCTEQASMDEPVVEIHCNGRGGWKIVVHASEHGAFMTYQHGDDPASQPLYPPSLGLFGHFHNVLEWREILGSPFATIHRYYHETPEEMSGRPDETYQTLMVTALRPNSADAACVVAFIDASGLSGANEVARDVADRLSRGWDCALEPIVFDADTPSVDAYLSRFGH
ncbi:hypothetical protein [Maricaulis parjimensis]|uniref:hypothetical protein n=1 Tax=Maricaulis parjimensis TaxID=144023 RepID=UPI00193975A7|nr:hypothetical protein [Maricaulis parjimensis]